MAVGHGKNGRVAMTWHVAPAPMFMPRVRGDRERRHGRSGVGGGVRGGRVGWGVGGKVPAPAVHLAATDAQVLGGLPPEDRLSDAYRRYLEQVCGVWVWVWWVCV